MYPVVSNSYQHWCLHAPPALPLGRTGEAAAGVRWCQPPRAWAPDHPCATPNSGSIPPYSPACIAHRHGHMPHRHRPTNPKKQIHFIRWRRNKVHVGTWIGNLRLNSCFQPQRLPWHPWHIIISFGIFLENWCDFQAARTLPWKKQLGWTHILTIFFRRSHATPCYNIYKICPAPQFHAAQSLDICQCHGLEDLQDSRDSLPKLEGVVKNKTYSKMPPWKNFGELNIRGHQFVTEKWSEQNNSVKSHADYLEVWVWLGILWPYCKHQNTWPV